jgi:hypothetical protein
VRKERDWGKQELRHKNAGINTQGRIGKMGDTWRGVETIGGRSLY